jgi:hypothetical protein
VQEATGSSMETATVSASTVDMPQMRIRKSGAELEDFCTSARKNSRSFLIHGIRRSFLDNYPQFAAAVSGPEDRNLTLVVQQGEVACLGTSEICSTAIAVATAGQALQVSLSNGHLLPGLTAVTANLGMVEISEDDSTGNGFQRTKDVKDPANIDFAKYGVYFDGKSFARARIGGVTRAITPPNLDLMDPTVLVQGISVGIKTSGTKTLLDGGIFQSDVGLHCIIGENNKGLGSVSMAIKTLRSILTDNKGKGNESAYGLVADGKLPLIIEVKSVVSQARMNEAGNLSNSVIPLSRILSKSYPLRETFLMSTLSLGEDTVRH